MADIKDRAQAKLRRLNIRPGNRFRHYKGGDYEVISLAIKEDTLESLVIYRSLAKESIWARTFNNWNEYIEMNGTKVKRFEKLS